MFLRVSIEGVLPDGVLLEDIPLEGELLEDVLLEDVPLGDEPPCGEALEPEGVLLGEVLLPVRVPIS